MSEIDLMIDDLSVFEIMQRFRTDGSCEHTIREALVMYALDRARTIPDSKPAMEYRGEVKGGCQFHREARNQHCPDCNTRK